MNRNDTESPQSDIAAALKAGEEIGKMRHRIIVPEFKHAMPFVVLRDEKGADSPELIGAVFEHPTSRIGTVPLDDADSFISYFEAHADEHSTIYAKQNPCKFVAVLDEHPRQPRLPGPINQVAQDPAYSPAQDPPPAPEQLIKSDLRDSPGPLEPPRFREFRATYAPSFSNEWETWNKRDRQHFESTQQFALFLEDNLPDIIDPPGAEMLEMALNFRVTNDMRFGAAQRLTDGHIQLDYQNIVEANAGRSGAGTIRIPEEFTIAVPVLAGVLQPVYSVRARFRFRLRDGAITLWYELVRPHKVIEAAFTDLWQKIAEGAGRTILLGSPE